MQDNYRAVTLLCTTYHILASILYIKLVPCAEEITEYQGGFQRRKSIVDQIFYYDTNIGKKGEHKKEVHHLFKDFQAANDTVWIKEIWSELLNQVSEKN
jgi:hypothetical protein